MTLDRVTLAPGDVFKMPRQARKRVAKRDVDILVMIVIDDKFMPRDAERNADIERPALALVPVPLLDDNPAAYDIRIGRGKLPDLVANPRGKRRGLRHMPERDLQRC